MSILLSQVVDTAGRMALAAVESSAAAESGKPAGPSEPGSVPAGEQPAVQAAAPAAAAADPEAQTTASTKADAKPWYEYGAMGYMIAGGMFMWPILAMGVLAAGVSIERWRTLKLLNVDTTRLRTKVLELLQADRGEEALDLCLDQQGRCRPCSRPEFANSCCSSD